MLTVLVLCAPALNYVWPYYHRHKALLPTDVRHKTQQLYVSNCLFLTFVYISLRVVHGFVFVL